MMKRKAFKAILVIAALTLAAVGLSLKAGSPYQYTRTYYTDATLTEMCGEKMVTCSGSTRWGCLTSYYVDIYDAPCGTDGGGGGGCTFALTGGCADGVDNDGDGRMDRDDPQCTCNSSSEF